MLTKISFNAGSSPGKAGLEFSLSPVTIFVGPNNSGKSRALIEIEGWVTRAQGPDGQIIKKLEFEPWDRAEFESEVAKIEVQPTLSETVNPDHVLLAKLRPQDNSAARVQVNREALFNDAANPNGKHRHHYANYLALYTLRLDGRNRLSLTDDKPSGDLLKVAPNHLAKLFIDNISRKEVRRIVFEAFGKHLVVDPTNIGQLRLRLSSTAPANDREEQGWDHAAQEFHRAASLLSDASDGVKAFVGMLTTLIAGEPKITLIDEPEAFLHPTLCARLGKEVTTALSNTRRRLFVATHRTLRAKGDILTVIRMDNVSIVVEDLDAAITFFTELGLALEGRMPVEGDWAGRVTGVRDQRVEIAMMRTPDGHSRIELSRFVAPAIVSDHRRAPVNSLGYLRVMFAVEDIDDTLARLMKIGATVVDEVVNYKDIYRLCYIRGPEGILIGLAQQLGQ
jgi:catechol 2,3-dioxygenase-like lactoylglutathione lyase family enzyme